MFRGLCLKLALVGALPASGVVGQEPAPPPDGNDELTLVMKDEGVRARVRLALPRMQRATGITLAGREAADELEETLQADLEYSGIFDLQDQEILKVLELTGDRSQDFPLYRSLGNQVVLLAQLSEERGRLTLEARVLDLANFRPICQSKRYRGKLDQARRIAHTYADEVTYCFSGRQGIALTTIVFSSNRSGYKELYMMDYDGENQRPLSGHKSITLAPDWSPTGEGLAYVSYFSGQPSIYYVDLATGEKRAILEDDWPNFSPSFSEDGLRIAFTRSVRGNADIFLTGRDGGTPERITDSSRIDANPAWSPSGGEIAFTSDRSGTPQIYVMDVDGGNLRRITRQGANNDGATWHPDGNRLAYAQRHESGNRFDIAIVDLVTLETQIITSGPGSHEAPSFSPDGRRLTFESTRNRTSQIYVIDVDGGNLRHLTEEGESFAPTWSSYLK